MNGEYIPFEVTNGEKKGIWQIDVANLSTLELIKLKEAFKGTTFSPTINGLDRLIYNSIENEFNCSYNMTKNGYYKEQKRNGSIKAYSKKKKVRRRFKNDKY